MVHSNLLHCWLISTDGDDTVCTEAVLTIPSYKAQKRQTSTWQVVFVLLGCIWWLMPSCLMQFLWLFREPSSLLCEGPVIRCSGTKAAAEIQSDVICAPSLIAYAMCRMVNLARESEEIPSSFASFQQQSMTGASSVRLHFFYSLFGTTSAQINCVLLCFCILSHKQCFAACPVQPHPCHNTGVSREQKAR